MAKEVSVIDVLKRTKSVLVRRGWVKGYYAKLRNGHITEIDNPKAVGYCLTGARRVAERELLAPNDVCRATIRAIEKCVPAPSTPEHFNDLPTTKKTDVIAVIDCAIKKATSA